MKAAIKIVTLGMFASCALCTAFQADTRLSAYLQRFHNGEWIMIDSGLTLSATVGPGTYRVFVVNESGMPGLYTFTWRSYRLTRGGIKSLDVFPDARRTWREYASCSLTSLPSFRSVDDIDHA
jgi:hypothetical protein